MAGCVLLALNWFQEEVEDMDIPVKKKWVAHPQAEVCHFLILAAMCSFLMSSSL